MIYYNIVYLSEHVFTDGIDSEIVLASRSSYLMHKSCIGNGIRQLTIAYVANFQCEISKLLF